MEPTRSSCRPATWCAILRPVRITSSHVTRGSRIASFFWLQSMIRDDGARSLRFDLDQTIQELSLGRGVEDAACVRLTGIYHNLIRYWADLSRKSSGRARRLLSCIVADLERACEELATLGAAGGGS